MVYIVAGQPAGKRRLSIFNPDPVQHFRGKRRRYSKAALSQKLNSVAAMLAIRVLLTRCCSGDFAEVHAI